MSDADKMKELEDRINALEASINSGKKVKKIKKESEVKDTEEKKEKKLNKYQVHMKAELERLTKEFPEMSHKEKFKKAAETYKKNNESV